MARPSKYTKDDLVNTLKSLGKQSISKGDIDSNSNIEIGSMTFIRYFGSWRNALDAAGLNVGKKTGRPKKTKKNKKVKKPNLMNRKKIWEGPIGFPETNNINNNIDELYANDLIVWKGQPLSQDFLRSIDEDFRDEIAKDLLNFLLKFDFIKDFKYRDREIQNAWKSLCKNVTHIEEVDGVKYIANAGSCGYKIYRYYFPNIIKISGNKRISIYDAVTNKETLWHVIRNRIGNTLLYDQEKNKDFGNLQFPMNLSISQIITGSKNSGLAHFGSQFKPHVAKAIYRKYIKKNDVVLDYSCGFGTRLLGLKSLGYDTKYLGYEPNTETYQYLNNLINDFGFNADIKQCGSEVEIFGEKIVDFAFSSPPYFDMEQYCNEETQCYNRYNDYNEWLEKYWRQTVINIKKMLKDDGKFGINIGGKANKFVQMLETDLNKIIVEEGFELIDTIYMKTTKSHLSGKKNKEEKFKLEGIFIYKKV